MIVQLQFLIMVNFGSGSRERFTRKKHDSSYPYNSIKYVLDEAKLDLNEIDQVVFYEKPFLSLKDY